jgi:hypothetical protein
MINILELDDVFLSIPKIRIFEVFKIFIRRPIITLFTHSVLADEH